MSSTRAPLLREVEAQDYGTFDAKFLETTQKGYIRKVLGITATQLGVTAAGSAIMMSRPDLFIPIITKGIFFWTTLIGSVVFSLLTYWKAQSFPLNFIFLSTFTIMETLLIGAVCLMSAQSLVVKALITCTGLCTVLTLWAWQSKFKFASLMGYVFMFNSALLVSALVSWLFGGGLGFEMFYNAGIGICYSFYLLYHMQNLLQKEDTNTDDYVMDSLMIYLDIVQLFLVILRMFRDRDD